MDIFPGEPGLAGFIEAKDDGSVSDNWSTISRAKLQSSHHHQQTNTQPFYRPDVLPVVQPKVVVNLLHNKSTTNPQQIEASTTNPQHLDVVDLLWLVGVYNESTTNPQQTEAV